MSDYKCLGIVLETIRQMTCSMHMQHINPVFNGACCMDCSCRFGPRWSSHSSHTPRQQHPQGSSPPRPLLAWQQHSSSSSRQQQRGPGCCPKEGNVDRVQHTAGSGPWGPGDWACGEWGGPATAAQEQPHSSSGEHRTAAGIAAGMSASNASSATCCFQHGEYIYLSLACA
jgi:hypothetical protein